jgi:hypothetical protein
VNFHFRALHTTQASAKLERSAPQFRKRFRELLERDQRLNLLQRPFLNRFDQRQQLLVFARRERLFLFEHSLQLALQRSRQLILGHLPQRASQALSAFRWDADEGTSPTVAVVMPILQAINFEVDFDASFSHRPFADDSGVQSDAP